MPVVRSFIPYRKSRRLHMTDAAYDDDLWETVDEAFLISSSSASATVKSEPSPRPARAPHLECWPHPRPRNAFICFRSEYVKAQKAASAKPGSLNQTVLSRGAGAAWRALSDEEREPFVLMALREKEEHAIRYPNYQYAPASHCVSGAARKNKKHRPAPSRRASSATSDSSDFCMRSPIPTSQSSRKYETSPPAPRRPVAQRKSTPIPVTPRPQARAFPEAPPVAEAETVIFKTEAPEPVYEKKDEFGFKADLSPTLIASLRLAPSRSPSPSPSMRVPSLALDDAIPSLSSRSLSPSPPAFEWDAWIYTPLEMNEDEEPLQFDAPSADCDFGFFHPWKLDDEVGRTLVALAN
ncbi:HMG box domain-containing protein [Mycena venus]|uniref:HMG box domain-containing protein n=1 Tax=Mycena venus TaxID=2733690 RepID=A0A8H6WNW6_9AGAR|nr:HMG box domain-containing protein [Mycena venus]